MSTASGTATGTGKAGGAAGAGRDADEAKPNIIFDEMSADMSQFTVDAAREGLELYKKGDLKDFSAVAKKIKEVLEEEYKGAWHVAIGLSFGNYVSHEAKRIVYFFFGELGFLCWCHG
eukprot:g4694.t1